MGFFADVVGGLSQLVSMNENPVSMNGNMRGVLLPAPKANGTFLERYFCREMLQVTEQEELLYAWPHWKRK